MGRQKIACSGTGAPRGSQGAPTLKETHNSVLFFGVIFERNGVVAGFGIKVHRVVVRPTDSGLRGGFVSWGARSGPRVVVGQLRATE